MMAKLGPVKRPCVCSRRSGTDLPAARAAPSHSLSRPAAVSFRRESGNVLPPRERSDLDDGDVLVEAGEVGRVSGVEPGVVCVSGGGDQQVHDATPRLASELHHRGR